MIRIVGGTRVERLRSVAYWLIPPLVCLAIYWPGLIAWFQQDDFAWLTLLDEVQGGRSIASALFKPTEEQGSLRPLGERAYYLGLRALFGLNPLPFRILAFLVQFGSLALAMGIVRRITGSKWAGLAAAILWIANCNLFLVMTWSAEFMLILCGFFLLLALDQFQRYAAGSGRRHLLWCWVAFVAGFGALESNAIFPLLAASWAVLFARKLVWKTLPMFGLSALYTVVHMMVAPKPRTGVYAIKIGWHMLKTLGTYWRLSFAPVALSDFTPFPEWLGQAGAWVFTLFAAAYVAWQWHRGRRAPAWFLCWFGITILPVLPLPRHISDYYLTLPVLGVAMLGADALLQAWSSGWAWRSLAAILALFYLMVQVPTAYGGSYWWYDRSVRGRNFLNVAVEAPRQYPGKAIVFTGFDDMLFFNVATHPALALVKASNVWIAPGTEKEVGADGSESNAAPYILSPELARTLLEQGALVVYHIDGRRISRVGDPSRFSPALKALAPAFFVDLGVREREWRLVQGWHAADAGARWMGPRAVLWISCTDPASQELVLAGQAPRQLFAHGPARLSITLDGKAAGSATLRETDLEFNLSFRLPAGLAGKDRVELRIECDRSIRIPPDLRELSLSFGRILVRKGRAAASGEGRS